MSSTILPMDYSLLFPPLIFSILLSLSSFAAVLTLAFSAGLTNRIILSLVGMAAGALLSVAFLDLLPEGARVNSPSFFLLTLAVVIIYLVLEKTLHVHHAHGSEHHIHSFGYVNLVGDMIHNLLDGVVMAGAYAISPALGISTFFAVALHELPREIGDFAVFVKAGFTKKKAAILNFLTSFASALGVFVGFYLSGLGGFLVSWLLPVATGSFLYVGMSDLLPMLRDKEDGQSFPWEVLMVIVGALLVGGVGYVLGD